MTENSTRWGYITWSRFLIVLLSLVGLGAAATLYVAKTTTAEHAALPYHAGSPAVKVIQDVEETRERLAVVESRLKRMEEDIQEIKEGVRELRKNSFGRR